MAGAEVWPGGKEQSRSNCVLRTRYCVNSVVLEA